MEAELRGLKHGMEYRLELNGEQVFDPAATVYSPPGRPLNSVFWDSQRPAAYKLQSPRVDLRARP